LGLKTGAIITGQPVNWASPLNRGLVSWWMAIPQGAHFGGARLLDLCGKNHGTLSAAPVWGSAVGRHGGHGRLNFVGGSAQGVNCGTSAEFTINNALTIALWFRPQVTTRGDIITKWQNGGSADDAFNLLYGLTSGKPQFFVASGSGASANSGVGSTAMAVGTWYHICGTYDGANVRVFLNGVQEASAAATLTMPTAGTRTVWLGRNNHTDGYTSGDIDSVRIYNRALLVSEIAAVLAEERSGYPTTLNRIRLPLVGEAGAAPGGDIPGYVMGGGFSGGRMFGSAA
jgi:hypothetical protein